jgi:hypothetical protein
MLQTLDVRTSSNLAAVALVRKLNLSVPVARRADGFHVAIPLTLETRLDLPDEIDGWATSLVERPDVRLTLQ